MFDVDVPRRLDRRLALGMNAAKVMHILPQSAQAQRDGARISAAP